MARGSYQGYVEDSEEEEIMTFDTSALAAHGVAGPSFLPPPPLPGRPEETTMSSIQTPSFTDVQSTRAPPPQQPSKNPDHTMLSAIQTPNFTVDRSVVSNISEFSPIPRPGPSNIQSAQSSKQADSSISTSASTSSVPRPRPRPRPAYKKKVADAAPDTSFPASSSSVSAPAAGGLLSTAPAPPHILALEPMGAPSHIPPTAATSLSKSTSGKERIPDSGVETDSLYAGDIAERAKLRSRARTQTQAKAADTSLDDGVISLSSDDELQLLSPIKPKPKPKPKPKAKKVSAGPSSGKDTGNGNSGKGKATVIIPPPSKRTKTTHLPDPGFESDVNTIPVPTSDFPAPAHIPGLHSSQLPPSDPPPSTATSSSARTHPQTSQEIEAAKRDRDLSPLSSPPPPMPRKRKRPSLPTALGLDSDVEDILGPAAGASKLLAKAKQTVKELPIAPPVPSPNIVPETQPPVKPKPAARKKRKEPVEDNDEDWAGEAVAKPAKSRKKARVTDDDDFGGGGGGDDDDDDWDAPSAKGKAKGKKAAKKAAPKEKKGRAKAKEKEKPPKSREVIEDSDEEGGGMLPPLIPASTSKPPASKAASPPTSATEARPPASSDVASSKKGGPKGKQRAVVLSDEEDGDEANVADISTNSISADIDSPAVPIAKKGGRKSTGGQQSPATETKENDVPASSTSIYGAASKPFATPVPSARSNFSNANRSYTIGAKSTKHTPMSELIRRASAQPGSPFPATARPVYSPLVKGSKAVLRRIAPLHPNRRTPPPAPPRAPPPKKTKKMLELEEKWEMELEDSVDGWYAMAESERAALKRAKKDAELGIYED
ncbi:hypothetical protein TRAPUB_1952 [Trametes pubescens]|uniref:Uncharacterized protein n=1 Tax=Trametes pubescens TaxID=154538 RepID=A0A1M2VHZ5_TRAPU|nr:hypothetical protein TRAPUB_1952 [Trametes pubescens]